MSALSDYLEQKVLDHLLNAVTLTPPATVYLALFTADPTDAGNGAEVSGGSYARQRIYANGGSAPDFNLAASDPPGFKVTNHDDITFPTATVAWGTVTHFGIMDASTSGNLLFHGELDESQVVGIGGIFKVIAGNLSLRLE